MASDTLPLVSRLHLLFGRENLLAEVHPAEDAPLGACIELVERDEHFEITPDTRGGKAGYRVMRYLPENDDPGSPMAWDQWFQFYPSLESFALAVIERDYEEGVKAF